MWNAGSTYNLSSGMAVAGEQPTCAWGGGGGRVLPWCPRQCWPFEPSCPDLSLPGAGMPTAYDLSSVIAGGSRVGHNNLIPLGEPTGVGAPRTTVSLGLLPYHLCFFPGS